MITNNSHTNQFMLQWNLYEVNWLYIVQLKYTLTYGKKINLFLTNSWSNKLGMHLHQILCNLDRLNVIRL